MTKFLEINGARIAYRVSGSGIPLVLLHSSASSGGQWKSLVDQLGEGFQAMAPDLFGYGASDPWPGDRPLTLADEAEIVTALVGELETPFHLVGHSYGGAVALRVALNNPGRIAKLVLIEPVAFYLLQSGRDAEHDEIAAVADAVERAIGAGDPEGGMAGFVDYWNGDGAWAGSRPDLRQELATRTGKVLGDFGAIGAEAAKLSDYTACEMPTLVLCAEHTRRPTAKIAEMLALTMPNAVHETVPGAGHMSPLTHAAVVNRAIETHLRGR